MNNIEHAGPAQMGAVSALPPQESASHDSKATTQPAYRSRGFWDFDDLKAAVPLGERTLRSEIRKGRIPSIRLPGGRRLLFAPDAVEKALRRFQSGGIPE